RQRRPARPARPPTRSAGALLQRFWPARSASVARPRLCRSGAWPRSGPAAVGDTVLSDSAPPPVSRRAKAPPLPRGDRNMNPPGISLRALVAEDYATHDRDWLSQGFWTLFWHRFGN